jgi:Tfp pilus assembly major pilin PilA
VRIRSTQSGFAVIDLLFVCGIVGIISGIALPRLVLARGAAGAASAIASMRVIGSSQVSFAITCGSGFYAPTLTALARPSPGSTEGFIKGDLGSADTVVKSGYTITMASTAFAGAPDTCNGLGLGVTGQAFKAAADPVGATTTRYFAINANNGIWEDTAPLFATMPEAGNPPSGQPLVR